MMHTSRRRRRGWGSNNHPKWASLLFSKSNREWHKRGRGVQEDRELITKLETIKHESIVKRAKAKKPR